MLSPAPISQKCSFLYQDLKTSQFFWSIIDLQNIRCTAKWLGGPWSIKWSRAKANRVLPRECTGHSKHHLPTTQQKTLHMDITNGQCWNQIDYILCSQRWKSSIQSAKTRPGADCGSDHELLIAKFRLRLKKIGKTTRPFRYDLNQIPYGYAVEVRNRLNRLDLIECLQNYGWTFMIVQEAEIKTIPKKNKFKKTKLLS